MAEKPPRNEEIRNRILADMRSQPNNPYFDLLYKYGEHMVTCENCDPAGGQVCDAGGDLAAQVVEFYRNNPPPSGKG